MIFLTCLDRNAPLQYGHVATKFEKSPIYWVMAKMLLHSLRHYHPESKVVFNALNFDDEHYEELREVHPEVVFRRRAHEWEPNVKRSVYMGTVIMERAYAALDLLDEHHEPVLYIDVDALVRGSLSRMEDELTKHDVAVFRRPQEQSQSKKFAIGTLGLADTEMARKLVRRWIEVMPDYAHAFGRDGRGRNRGGGQLFFDKAFRELKPRHWQLPWPFIDMYRKPKGLIWHANRGHKIDRLREFLDDFESVHGETDYTKTGRSLL